MRHALTAALIALVALGANPSYAATIATGLISSNNQAGYLECRVANISDKETLVIVKVIHESGTVLADNGDGSMVAPGAFTSRAGALSPGFSGRCVVIGKKNALRVSACVQQPAPPALATTKMCLPGQ